MIKNKKVQILINRGNLPYYVNKYNINPNIGDIIQIDIDTLPSGSNIVIIATCHFCKKDVNIKYRLYNKSFNKNGSFACSRKCASIRTRDILFEKYGVKNIAQVPSIKESIIQTNNKKYGKDHYFSSDISKDKNKRIFTEKYGVDNPSKSDYIKDKIIKTNLVKWGVKYTLQNKDIRDKITKTNLEKWGTETPSKNNIVRDKIIKTNLEKWGGNSPMCNDIIKSKSRNTTFDNWNVYNPNQSDIIKEKIRKTNLEELGVEYPSQSKQVQEKIKRNNLKKWGAEHVNQSEKYRVENTTIGRNKFYLEYKGDKTSIFKCDVDRNHSFEINTDNFFSRTRQGIPLCTICYPINNTRSYLECELFDFIKSEYDSEIIQSYRDGLEIDIYLPESKIGFEFNGLYWHSEKYKDKNYHIDKTNYFKERGIRIIHIWEDDWIYRSNILKSQISNILNNNSHKIYARKCKIYPINDKKLIKEFLDDNHIQGNINSKIKLGLFTDNELISVMTFDQFEGRKKMQDGNWNLSRFCNKLKTTSIGGASRLLKYFIDNYNPSRIISYADKDWSQGDLYYKLGFELIFQSNPDYKYLVDGKRIHKSNYKKSKLNTILSENEHMKFQNINKIWDCGKLKFELNK